jgi:hypothetical protein
MSEIKIQPVPPGGDLVPVTQDEALAWMAAYGRVMTVERGGQLYRVLEVGETGEPRPSEAAQVVR